MNCKNIVDEVLNGYRDAETSLMGIGKSEDEYKYLYAQKDAYIRTVSDIQNLYKDNEKEKKVLEIGSFLGAVSISLKKIGFWIEALDIPEFYQSEPLRALYEKNGIPFQGVNLKNQQLPYASNSFDVIIICEVIEHLNFNPLLIMQEINRVLKKGGYIYIGMPNQAHITQRIKLLFGKSIRNSIGDYFQQFNRHSNMIVGIHWREYTLTETVELIEKMGFETVAKYYHMDQNQNMKISDFIKRMLYYIPSFRPFFVLIGQKRSEPVYDFWLTDANS